MMSARSCRLSGYMFAIGVVWLASPGFATAQSVPSYYGPRRGSPASTG